VSSSVAIASRWFISGLRSFFSRFPARAAATTCCRFCRPEPSWVARLLATPTEALSQLGRRLLAGLVTPVIAIAVAGGSIAMIPPQWIMREDAGDAAAGARPHYLCDLLGGLAVSGVYTLKRFDTRRVRCRRRRSGRFLWGTCSSRDAAAGSVARREAFAEDIRKQMARQPTGVVLYKTVGPLYYLRLPNPLPYYGDVGKLDAGTRSATSCDG